MAGSQMDPFFFLNNLVKRTKECLKKKSSIQGNVILFHTGACVEVAQNNRDGLVKGASNIGGPGPRPAPVGPVHAGTSAGTSPSIV